MLQVKVQKKIYHIEKTFYALSFHRLHFLEFFYSISFIMNQKMYDYSHNLLYEPENKESYV